MTTVRTDGKLTIALCVAILALSATGVFAFDRTTRDQLPSQWSRLVPTPTEVANSTVFPVAKPPADGSEMPWRFPVQTKVTESLRVDAADATTGIEMVMANYSITETARWREGNREVTLWNASLELSVRRMFNEQQAREAYQRDYNQGVDTPLQIGDEANLDRAHNLGDDHERVSARVGVFMVHVSSDVGRGLYTGAAREAMKTLIVAIATDTVARLEAGPQPGFGMQVGQQNGGANAGGQPDAQPPAAADQIEVRGELAGWETQTRRIEVPAGKIPGRITIRVTTLQSMQGRPQPLPGVTVSLPGYNVTTITSQQGTAVLRAEGPGRDEIISAVTLTLRRLTTTLRVDLAGATLLPVGGSGQVTATVRDGTTGAPAQNATVRFTILNAASQPFVQLGGQPDGSTAADGTLSRQITVSPPTQQMVDAGQLTLHDLPLSVTVKAEAWLTDQPAVRGEAQISVPIDLLMLTGQTVGPNFQPRSEARAPRLLAPGAARPWLASALHPAEPGRFHVLVRASMFGLDSTLVWPPGCRLNLQLPLRQIESRLAGQSMNAGATLDLGQIDILEPAEHVARIKSWVNEMLGAMGFDNGHLAETRAAVEALPVLYTQGTADQPPAYGSGAIHIYQPEQEWWGAKAFTEQDPAYGIIFHEMGHMVHKQMVDRWLRVLGLWDKCFIGGAHSTWTTPAASTDSGRAMTSYFEALADFFAYCLYEHLRSAHPEFTAHSIYAERGYFAQFQTDSRALASLGPGGWQVEGVQTTFWRELHAGDFASGNAARAIGDVLRMAERYKNESIVLRWVPARTIRQWVAMKRKHGPTDTLEQLVRKYALEGGTIARVIMPTGPEARSTRVAIAGVERRLEGDTFAAEIPVGQPVEMLEGQGLVMVEQVGQPALWRRLYVDQGTRFTFETADRLRLHSGRVIVDGAIAVTSGTTTVAPTGTVVLVEVAPAGAAAVTVVEGSARVQTPQGSADLSAGQMTAIAADGSMSAPQTVDAAVAVAAVMSSGGAPGPGPAGTTTPAQPQPAHELAPMELLATSAVKKAIICLGVNDVGELFGVQDVFPADTEKIALYLEFEGAPANSEIQFSYYHDGKLIARQLLIVSGDRRTISYFFASNNPTLWPGHYAIEIRENGKLVGRRLFEVTD